MILYKTTNFKNNKVYFSISSKRINIWFSVQKSVARMKRKKMKLKDGRISKSPFHKALVKYGEWNFGTEIIDRNLSKTDAYKLKEQLIKEYNANNPKYGYNCTTGGESFKHNQEVIERISKGHSGKIMPESFVRMMKEKVGEKHPCYGYKHSDEAKENMRQGQLNSDYIESEESKKRKSEAMKRHWKNPTEQMLKDGYNRKHQIGSRDIRGKKNPMYGKGMKGKDNPMYGRTGKLHPLYGRKLSKEHLEKLQAGRLKYLADKKAKLLEKKGEVNNDTE